MIHLDLEILERAINGDIMATYTFEYDKRLEIEVPSFLLEWDQYSLEEQAEILLRWEGIRGNIPDRVMKLEKEIIMRQSELDQEDNFETSCRLNWEIADLASIINDLHLWFRVNQDMDSKMHQ